MKTRNHACAYLPTVVYSAKSCDSNVKSMPNSVTLMSRSKVLIAITMKRSRLRSITVVSRVMTARVLMYALGLMVSLEELVMDMGNLTICAAVALVAGAAAMVTTLQPFLPSQGFPAATAQETIFWRRR